jgi:thiamine-phosphate pyrophosphorylase
MPFAVPSVTLIIDRRLYRVNGEGEAPLSLVEAAIEGGVGMVQLRLGGDSDVHIAGADDLAATAVALRLREMTTNHVPFLVTGDIKLADRSRSDGIVLIGDKTYRPDDAREYLKSTAVVGCYVDSLRSAAIAEHGGADFVQIGPLFDGDGDTCLTLIRKVKDGVNIPVVAYGGIDTPERAKAAVDAGADGIAVAKTILDAPDPKLAAKALHLAVSK